MEAHFVVVYFLFIIVVIPAYGVWCVEVPNTARRLVGSITFAVTVYEVMFMCVFYSPIWMLVMLLVGIYTRTT